MRAIPEKLRAFVVEGKTSVLVVLLDCCGKGRKVLLSHFSQRRSPGHYRKDEHGQECESQRRGRHGISIAPHGYEKSGNGCGTQGNDQGEQEAHTTFLPALSMPSISFLLRGMTMRVRNRSTFSQCESFYGTLRIAADAMSDKTGGVRHGSEHLRVSQIPPPFYRSSSW
jgi:hypothetical protein